MAEHNEVVNQIYVVLSSLKSSVDRVRSRRVRHISEINDASDVIGRLEKIRFRFNSLARYSTTKEINADTFYDSIYDLKINLTDALDDVYKRVTSEVEFRVQSPFPRQDPRIPPLFNYFPRFIDRMSAFDATSLMIDACDFFLSIEFNPEAQPIAQHSLEFRNDLGNKIEAINDLKKIVPAQKVAPIKFKIENNKILIDRESSKAAAEDVSNIDIAKRQILENGESILQQLKNSNCDKRLIENIEYLQDQINCNVSAIQVGISNISFGIISETFKGELPDAVNASLQSHHLAINMYVGQFPDWIRFSANAASAELDNADAETVKHSVKTLIDDLEKNQEITEPAVIKAFRSIAGALENPTKGGKRAVFAVIRTIENLLSKIFHYAIEFFEEIVKQTVKETTKIISKGVAITLVTLGISGASGMIELSPKIKELTWLKNAIEIVKKQIK